MDLKDFISGYGITSSQQLIDLAKELNINLKYVGITNNLINVKPITNGSYIINIGDPGSGGTHWTSLFVQGNEAFYFDSYAVAPEDDLIDILNTNSKVNKVTYNNNYQTQGVDESLCGIWSIMLLYHMQNSKKKDLKDRFNEFAKDYKDLD
jgi:transposase